MHGARVVGKQQMALSQFVDELFQRGLADPVHAMIADGSRDLFADRGIVLSTE